MATHKINIPARNRAIDEALGVVCGVDHASGPDRTGLTFLVPGKGMPPIAEGPRDCAECGATYMQRCFPECPRVIRWKASRCGARPPRGAVLDLGDHGKGVRFATGEELCTNGKGCNGCHVADVDFGRMSWTDAPVFHDCAVCGARVMPYGQFGPMGYQGRTEKGEWKTGIFCDMCNEHHRVAGHPLMEWHGDRLVRKAAGPTLRIYDATGCVLAEGPMRAERTAMGVRLHFAGQCCATGTAECYAVYANGKQVTWGQMGRGVRSLHMTRALSSGLYLTIALDVNDASEEQLQALGATAKPTFDITATMEPFTDAFKRLAASAMSASESMLHAFAPAAGFCTFIANLKAYDARERGEKAERRQREAALVALVNDVPEGLDPVGWRAAVLAAAEFWRVRRVLVGWPKGDEGKEFADAFARTMRGDPGWEPTPWTSRGASFDAYRRAIAPHKASAPEKRRGGKAVRLTVDDGRDDD